LPKRDPLTKVALRGSSMARILLVDDEEHIRQLYSEELADEGHKVWTTATGHELLKTIDSLQPEVVVLDIRLVDYDGLDLLQEVRNKHHNLPVILCTAYDTYKEDLKSIAANYYVVKSFDLTELKLAIYRAIEAKSGQD
jgi:DNA-binding NtrC family response regulator